MSADLLRRAATQMRERAEVATPGPWRFTDSEVVDDCYESGMVVVGAEGDPIANAQDDWYENDPGEPAPLNDAQHIASWHPTVALAVADWLDDQARYWDAVDAAPAYMEGDPASVVARAYLGES